jgi:hypothetical protein
MALVSLGEALHLHLRALLKVRQQRLGHSDPRLTLNVYTQVASEDDERVAAQLGELVTGIPCPGCKKKWVARIEQPFVN